MEYNKPDFKKVNMLANEILVASSVISSFPVDAKRIVEEWSDIRIHTFKYAQERGIDIEAFGSNAALLVCKKGRYIIFYNERDYLPRVNFSILHEFAHYRCNHELLHYSNDEKYGKLEVEANCFAAQILMPEQVINELRSRGAIIKAEFLRKKFGVSLEAANRRIETLGKYNYNWRSSDEKLFDETILFKYSEFMDSIMSKVNDNNWYEDEYERQRERDSWYSDNRTRYKY